MTGVCGLTIWCEMSARPAKNRKNKSCAFSLDGIISQAGYDVTYFPFSGAPKTYPNPPTLATDGALSVSLSLQ